MMFAPLLLVELGLVLLLDLFGVVLLAFKHLLTFLNLHLS
jgi:hypothetical protein